MKIIKKTKNNKHNSVSMITYNALFWNKSLKGSNITTPRVPLSPYYLKVQKDTSNLFCFLDTLPSDNRINGQS